MNQVDPVEQLHNAKVLFLKALQFKVISGDPVEHLFPGVTEFQIEQLKRASSQDLDAMARLYQIVPTPEALSRLESLLANSH